MYYLLTYLLTNRPRMFGFLHPTTRIRKNSECKLCVTSDSIWNQYINAWAGCIGSNPGKITPVTWRRRRHKKSPARNIISTVSRKSETKRSEWFLERNRNSQLKVSYCLTTTAKYAKTTLQLLSAQVQYNCNARIFLLYCAQLYCTCADPCDTTLQYKFSTTCGKLAGYLQQL